MQNLIKLDKYEGLTKQDSQLVNLGFYPCKLSKNRKQFVVRDLANDRELHFELEDYVFNIVDYVDLPEKIKIPSKIKRVIENDDNEVFDEYKVIYPAEDFDQEDEEMEPINKDPFLVGMRGKKMFLISSWGSDVWDGFNKLELE